MKRLCFLMLLFFSLTGVHAAEETVKVEGSGRSHRAAIEAALITALEQKCGIMLTSTERSAISEADKAAYRDGRDSSQIENSETFLKTAQKWTKGRISGYQEIAHEFDKKEGVHHVTLLVSFPGRYVVGRDPNRLRKMAVGNFQAKTPVFSFCGKRLSASDWSAQFSRELNVYLTQTRKFTMLDRSFSREINAELALLNDENAAPGEMQKLNQKLGTDYLILGEIAFSDVLPGTENPLTGEVMPPPSTIFASVHYRVILAPTGQLKWADTVQIDAAPFTGSLFAGDFSESAAYAANCVCANIMANILPFEIAKIFEDGTVVINEGGKALSEGEFLSVYAKGEVVRDPHSGEVLDRLESYVGLVQITKVSGKISYAKVIKGDPAKMPVGAILRRDSQSARMNAPATLPAGTPSGVRNTSNGGVVVPF